MRLSLCRSLPVLVAAAMLGSASAAQWQSGPSFPAPRLEATGLTLAGEVLAVGGFPLIGNDSNASVHGIAPGAASWTTHATLEGPAVESGAGVDALGRIVVFGGLDALDPEGDEGKTYVYDLVEGKKTTLADRSSAAPTTGFAWATDAQGRLYSIGGTPGSTRVERYDAGANAWQILAPLPEGRARAAAVADGTGRVLVIGGTAPGGAPSAAVFAYDVATGAWSAGDVGTLPESVTDAAAALGADGRLYVVGGTLAGGAPSAHTWVLDLALGTWSAGPDLATARRRPGLALGPDDRLWAMGGDDGTGGTATVERLYTPPCPTLADAPANAIAWAGLSASLHVDATGGTPLALRWERDGQPLFDGPSAGGGWLTGTDTHTLHFAGAGAADAGAYRLVATNPCGTSSSDPIALEVREAPVIGAWRTVQRLDPYGGSTSSASALDGVTIAGHAFAPAPPWADQEQALLWNADGSIAATLTPSSSVGATVAAAENGVQVGAWWWPYTTPLGTGYYRHAAAWSGSMATHVDIQPSGWEIGYATDTDGTRHVGVLRWSDESTTVDAAYWPSSAKFAHILTPASAWGSSAAALDGDNQYGLVNLGYGVNHAARWSGSAASFVDMNPPGSSWSSISGAASGQAVGFATFGGTKHAYVWCGGPDDGVDLDPTGATASRLVATDGGLQLGYASYGLGERATLWRGAPDERVDLVEELGPSFTGGTANDVEVAPSGRITVAGSAYDPVAGRSEAIAWRFQPEPLVAEPATLPLSAGGRQELFLASGRAHAGELYWVVGSASGATPGVPLGGGYVLPLAYDWYLTWTLTEANGAVLRQTLGLLDDFGGAHAAVELPAGIAPALANATLHHAFVALSLTADVTFVSNAAPLMLLP